MKYSNVWYIYYFYIFVNKNGRLGGFEIEVICFLKDDFIVRGLDFYLVMDVIDNIVMFLSK